MKAILLLAVVFSTNAFAGSYFTMEHNQLLKEQQVAAETRAKNPQLFAALEAKSGLEVQVDRLESRIARLERKKAFLCHTPDYGDRISVEAKFDSMRACRASNKFTEDSAKLDAEITDADQQLNYYSGMLELKRQEIAFWQTRYKH